MIGLDLRDTVRNVAADDMWLVTKMSSICYAPAGNDVNKSGSKHDKGVSLLPNNQQCRVARLDPQGVHLNQRRLQVCSSLHAQ